MWKFTKILALLSSFTLVSWAKIEEVPSLEDLESMLKQIDQRMESIQSRKKEGVLKQASSATKNKPKKGVHSDYDSMMHQNKDMNARIERVINLRFNVEVPSSESKSVLPTENLQAVDKTDLLIPPERQDLKEQTNSLSFHFGFCLPSQSKFKDYGLEFENGHILKLEYQRKIGDLIIGGSISYKSFENEKLKTGIVGLGNIAAFGEHLVLTPAFTLGWRPMINRLIYYEGKLSLGTAFSNHEISLVNSTLEDSSSGVYYSLSLGLGFQWSDHFHSMISYEYDGHENSGKFDHQNYHQICVSIGADY